MNADFFIGLLIGSLTVFIYTTIRLYRILRKNPRMIPLITAPLENSTFILASYTHKEVLMFDTIKEMNKYYENKIATDDQGDYNFYITTGKYH